MSAMLICRECHHAFRMGELIGSCCRSCFRQIGELAKAERDRNEQRTELAVDLVRGVSEGEAND